MIIWAFGTWFISARKWFTGPIRQIQAEEMGIDIDDPAAMAKAEEEGKLPQPAVNEAKTD